MNAAPSFKRIALIGFGLIGGSIARAAREQGLAGEIVTTARSAKTRARVKELGIVDRVVDTNAEAVDDADLVILCIPVGACGAVAREIAPYLKPGAVVSDVGSVKGAVVRDMAPHLPAGAHFVPANAEIGADNDQGAMTSVAFSPSLEHWIGLGLLQRGPQRVGERVWAVDPVRNNNVEVEICAPCFIDPQGERLRA